MPTQATAAHHARIAQMTYAAVHPCYVTKIEKKGRTRAELLEVISWLTGYTEADLDRHIAAGSTLETFFAEATLHPNASLITGTICGYRIQDLDNELTRQVRYLDKLVDELARGRSMARILRS